MRILKRIGLLTASIAIFALLSSGILANIGVFLEWLFKLKYTQPETSVTGSIIVRILTFVTSYSLVGLVFELTGLFYKRLMSIAYTIISTLTGFVFAYIVWQIEEHLLAIIIAISIISALAITFWILYFVLNKKKEKDNG